MDAVVDISDVVLETDRLVLRGWEKEDLNDFYEYAKVDGVGQMAGWVPHESIEKSEMILNLFINEKKTFGLVYKENNKVIGSLGLESSLRSELSEEFLALKGREVGYVLSKDYWGRGLMPEAVNAVIRYCFEIEQYDFLTCGHFNRNHQSQRVIEKCGFSYLINTKFSTRMNTVEEGKLYVLMNKKSINKY